MTRIKLMPHEEVLGFTVKFATFYDLDGSLQLNEIVENFKARFEKVVRANSWLGYKLVHEVNACYLSDSSLSKTEDMLSVMKNDVIFQTKSITELLQEMELDWLNSELGNVFSMTLLHDCAESKICIVTAINHKVVDGATIFRIWSMFDLNSEPYSLNVDRLMDFQDKVQDFSSLSNIPNSNNAKLWDMITTIPRCIYRTWFYQKASCHCFMLKSSEIDNIKTSFIDMVSKNDVIHSWFCSKIGADKASCAVDCRGRIPGITKNLAGNYLCPLWSDHGTYKFHINFVL